MCAVDRGWELVTRQNLFESEVTVNLDENSGIRDAVSVRAVIRTTQHHIRLEVINTTMWRLANDLVWINWLRCWPHRGSLVLDRVRSLCVAFKQMGVLRIVAMSTALATMFQKNVGCQNVNFFYDSRMQAAELFLYFTAMKFWNSEIGACVLGKWSVHFYALDMFHTVVVMFIKSPCYDFYKVIPKPGYSGSCHCRSDRFR